MLTPDEAANRLALTRRQLLLLCRSGAIKSTRINSRVIRIPVAELDRYTNRKTK